VALLSWPGVVDNVSGVDVIVDDNVSDVACRCCRRGWYVRIVVLMWFNTSALSSLCLCCSTGVVLAIVFVVFVVFGDHSHLLVVNVVERKVVGANTLGVASTPFSQRLRPGWHSLVLVMWRFYLLAGQAGRQWSGTHQGPFPFPSSTVLGFVTFSAVFLGVFIVVGVGICCRRASRRGAVTVFTMVNGSLHPSLEGRGLLRRRKVQGNLKSEYQVSKTYFKQKWHTFYVMLCLPR